MENIKNTFAATPTEAPAIRRSGDDPAGTDSASDFAEAPRGQSPEAVDDGLARFRVKIRGEMREVGLADVLQGYARLEDYKAATEELARQQKTLNAYQAALPVSPSTISPGSGDSSDAGEARQSVDSEFNDDEKRYLQALGYRVEEFAIEVGERERALLRDALHYRRYLADREGSVRAAASRAQAQAQRLKDARQHMAVLKKRALQGGLDEQADFFLATFRQE